MSFLDSVLKFLRLRKKHKLWLRAIFSLAMAVVFATTYMLILPAITLETPTYCGKQEHIHTDECYEKVLACEYADASSEEAEKPDAPPTFTCTQDLHSHTPDCYDDEGNLICGYADFYVHTHDDLCYYNGELVCPLEEIQAHTHDDGCFTEEETLVCGLEEEEGHTHDDSCYERWEELVCSDTSEEHSHDSSCYEQREQLICGLEEKEGHTHDSSCYEYTKKLTCDLPQVHTHDESCGFGSDCLLPEIHEHTHSTECMSTNGHVHTDECYENKLVCGMEEHQHTAECSIKPAESEAGGNTEENDGAQDETKPDEPAIVPDDTVVTNSSITIEDDPSVPDNLLGIFDDIQQSAENAKPSKPIAVVTPHFESIPNAISLDGEEEEGASYQDSLVVNEIRDGGANRGGYSYDSIKEDMAEALDYEDMDKFDENLLDMALIDIYYDGEYTDLNSYPATIDLTYSLDAPMGASSLHVFSIGNDGAVEITPTSISRENDSATEFVYEVTNLNTTFGLLSEGFFPGYISGVQITKVADGTPVWDDKETAGYTPGYDSDDSNKIVRTFDSVTYTTTITSASCSDAGDYVFDTDHTDPVIVDVQLDADITRFRFNTSGMAWLGNAEGWRINYYKGTTDSREETDIVLYEDATGLHKADGSDTYVRDVINNAGNANPYSSKDGITHQVLLAPYTLREVGGTTIGDQVISVSVGVLASHEGDTLEPAFKFYFEGNPENKNGESGSVISENVLKISKDSATSDNVVTVTAGPYYGVHLAANTDLKYHSIFDLAKGDEVTVRNKNSLNGRMFGYGVTLELHNKTNSTDKDVLFKKGIKGIELPKGDINVDLTLNVTGTAKASANGKTAINAITYTDLMGENVLDGDENSVITPVEGSEEAPQEQVESAMSTGAYIPRPLIPAEGTADYENSVALPRPLIETNALTGEKPTAARTLSQVLYTAISADDYGIMPMALIVDNDNTYGVVHTKSGSNESWDFTGISTSSNIPLSKDDDIFGIIYAVASTSNSQLNSSKYLYLRNGAAIKVPVASGSTAGTITITYNQARDDSYLTVGSTTGTKIPETGDNHSYTYSEADVADGYLWLYSTNNTQINKIEVVDTSGAEPPDTDTTSEATTASEGTTASEATTAAGGGGDVGGGGRQDGAPAGVVGGYVYFQNQKGYNTADDTCAKAVDVQGFTGIDYTSYVSGQKGYSEIGLSGKYIFNFDDTPPGASSSLDTTDKNFSINIGSWTGNWTTGLRGGDYSKSLTITVPKDTDANSANFYLYMYEVKGAMRISKVGDNSNGVPIYKDLTTGPASDAKVYEVTNLQPGESYTIAPLAATNYKIIAMALFTLEAPLDDTTGGGWIEGHKTPTEDIPEEQEAYIFFGSHAGSTGDFPKEGTPSVNIEENYANVHHYYSGDRSGEDIGTDTPVVFSVTPGPSTGNSTASDTTNDIVVSAKIGPAETAKDGDIGSYDVAQYSQNKAHVFTIHVPDDKTVPGIKSAKLMLYERDIKTFRLIDKDYKDPTASPDALEQVRSVTNKATKEGGVMVEFDGLEPGKTYTLDANGETYRYYFIALVTQTTPPETLDWKTTVPNQAAVYTPFIWDYNANVETTKYGKWKRFVDWDKGNERSNIAKQAAPYNSAGYKSGTPDDTQDNPRSIDNNVDYGLNDERQCFYGGNWSIDDGKKITLPSQILDGDKSLTKTYTITVSGYNFDFDTYHFPTNFARDSLGTQTYYNAGFGQYINAFSAGHMQVLVPYPESGYSGGLSLEAKVGELTVTSVGDKTGQTLAPDSGTTGDDKNKDNGENNEKKSIDANQDKKNDVETLRVRATSRHNSFKSKGALDIDSDMTGEGGAGVWLGTDGWNSSTVSDASAAIDEEIEIWGAGMLRQDSDLSLSAINVLQLYDSAAFEITGDAKPGSVVQGLQDQKIVTDINILYAGDPKHKSGYDTVSGSPTVADMGKINEEDLVFYNSREELKNAGYECVGVLMEVRGNGIPRGNYISVKIPVKVRHVIANIGEVYVTMSRIRAWSYNRELGDDNQPMENVTWGNVSVSDMGKGTLPADYKAFVPDTISHANSSNVAADQNDKVEVDGSVCYFFNNFSSGGTDNAFVYKKTEYIPWDTGEPWDSTGKAADNTKVGTGVTDYHKRGQECGVSLLVTGYESEVKIKYTNDTGTYDKLNGERPKFELSGIYPKIYTATVQESENEYSDLIVQVNQTNTIGAHGVGPLQMVADSLTIPSTDVYDVTGGGEVPGPIVFKNGETKKIKFTGSNGTVYNNVEITVEYPGNNNDFCIIKVNDAPLGVELPKMEFTTTIRNWVGNNDQAEIQAVISGSGDLRTHSKSVGNLDNSTISIMNEGGTGFYKSPDTPKEISAFADGTYMNYTINYSNAEGTSAIADRNFFDVMPIINGHIGLKVLNVQIDTLDDSGNVESTHPWARVYYTTADRDSLTESTNGWVSLKNRDQLPGNANYPETTAPSITEVAETGSGTGTFDFSGVDEETAKKITGLYFRVGDDGDSSTDPAIPAGKSMRVTITVDVNEKIAGYYDNIAYLLTNADEPTASYDQTQIAKDIVVGRTIKGRVWNDKDQDGYQDSDEDGIDGANVYLFKRTTAEPTGEYTAQQTDMMNVLFGTKGAKVTKDGGYYSFVNIPDGSYIIGVDTNITGDTPEDRYHNTLSSENTAITSDKNNDGINIDNIDISDSNVTGLITALKDLECDYIIAYDAEKPDDKVTSVTPTEMLLLDEIVAQVGKGTVNSQYRQTEDNLDLGITESSYSLPETGGVGTRWFVFGGMGLAGLALAALIIEARRKKRFIK